jgi:uncharacterized phage-associated protein
MAKAVTPVSVFDVADYAIAHADPDEGLTNLKLQKLCGYAQAYYLVLQGRRLFKESLEAWPHGPVVRELYDFYRSYGKNPLSTAIQPGEESRQPFTPEQLFILETVNGYYGRFAAWALRNMSHFDFPGEFDNPRRPRISDQDIKSRFAGHKIIQKIQAAF